MRFNILPNKNQIYKDLLNIFNCFKGAIFAKGYGLYFSLAYALILVLQFYPGVLYSDTVPRWNLAIEFHNNGFTNLSNHSSHHPVIPSILQSFFYAITKDVGFFIFTQVFLFSYAIFLFARELSESKYINIITTLLLLAPINYIYALFHSFDSIYAILNIFLIYFIYKTYRCSSFKYYIYLIACIFLLVSVRLNSILLAPVIAALYFYGIKNKHNLKLSLIQTVVILLVAYSPFVITSSLNMKTSNSWVIGFAWEYANLATKSENPKHRDFISSLGGDIEKIESNICYNGIWCGSERPEFISKVSHDNALTKETFLNYLNLAVHEPTLFAKEKAKYIGSIMGVGRALSNSEIGRWRDHNWAEQHKKLGFVTNDNKEKIIDNYFKFSKSVSFLFQPYKVLLIGLIILACTWFLNRRATLILSIGLSLSWFYYFTFFITSQNHEFRYFFPVLYFTQFVFIVCTASLLTKIKETYICLASLLIILSILFYYFIHPVYKEYSEKQALLESINEIKILKQNTLSLNYNDRDLIFVSSDCGKSLATRFFLHLIPTSVELLPEPRQQYGFDNLDFNWAQNQIADQSLFIPDDTCVATVSLPQYPINGVRTGQYNQDGRLWESHIDLTDMRFATEVQPFELTDGNWINGISRNRNGFFVENTFENRQSLRVGDILVFAHSGERVVQQITYSNRYINVFVSGDSLSLEADGFPNMIGLKK